MFKLNIAYDKIVACKNLTIKELNMKRFIMMLGLLGGYAYDVQADEIDSPTVNSRLASSVEFLEDNAFNGDGKVSSNSKRLE